MTCTSQNDWEPDAYGRFADLRMRPAFDLLGAIGQVPAGEIVDLGCGTGVMGSALRKRFQYERIHGVDLSPAMLDQAQTAVGYDKLEKCDIAAWEADRRPALIFCNAALHWLQGHDLLLPRLAKMLLPGGCLAVQMPAQNDAPSHVVWRELAPHIADQSGINSPREYLEILADLGAVQLWETVYYQRLEPWKAGHPVRRFTQSTYARPYLEGLDPKEVRTLETAYDLRMHEEYPLDKKGYVVFPFKRLFFTLTRPETDPLLKL